MSDWMQNVAMEDIPDQYQHLAEMMGVQALLALSGEYGGGKLYVPQLDTLVRAARDKMIKDEYNGRNAPELAQKYGLSVRWIELIALGNQVVGQMSIWDQGA